MNVEGLPPDVTCAGCGDSAHAFAFALSNRVHTSTGSWRISKDAAGVIHWTHRCARVSPHADHWRVDRPSAPSLAAVTGYRPPQTLTELLGRLTSTAVLPDSWEEMWRLAKAASLASKHLIDTGQGSAEYERATADLRDYLTADRILRMIPPQERKP